MQRLKQQQQQHQQHKQQQQEQQQQQHQQRHQQHKQQQKQQQQQQRQQQQELQQELQKQQQQHQQLGVWRQSGLVAAAAGTAAAAVVVVTKSAAAVAAAAVTAVAVTAAAAATAAAASMANKKRRRGLAGVFATLRKDASNPKRSSEVSSEDVPSANPPPQTPEPQTLNPSSSAASTVKQKAASVQVPEAVALDCEMVGCGEDGSISVLAQVALVDEKGQTLINELVKPQLPVTDLRAHVTGLDLWSLENRGISFAAARNLIAQKVKGKVLVGHAIHHDLQVLDLTHPVHLLRDTSRYRPLRPPFLRPQASPSLRLLVKHHFNREIQRGSHDPTEDAREAMNLYLLVKQQWNRRFAAAAGAAAVGADTDAEQSPPTDNEAPDVELLLQQLQQKQREKLRQQQQQQGRKKKRKRKDPHEYFLD